MPSKAESYLQMSEQVTTQLTGSWQEWTAFLTTAARLYKYPFHEQMMIYAQRPDATACAEYDLWNDKMRRYVRRGSKGIALVDTSREKPRLHYVFDISDTGLRENSRHPFLWQLRPEHETEVTAALEQWFGVPPENNLEEQLKSIAAQLASEYWVEHKRDILAIVDGSFLEGYDEFNIGVQFRNAAAVSITYSLLSRCGLETDFTHEDFLSIFDFNTPEAVAALGTAVSQSSQQVLRQISITIKNYEQSKYAERSATHGEQPDLYEERRLPDPQPETGGNEPLEPVRENAPGLSEGASPRPVQRHVGERETVPALKRDRTDREPASGTDDAGADESGGRDGGVESQRPNEVGGPDEQLQGPGRGNPSDGTYIQLTLFPSEWEQIRRMGEGPGVEPSGPSAVPEPETAPPALAAPRRELTQEDIDAAIQEWNGNIESKREVVRYMKNHGREKDAAAWLRREYGDDLPAFPVTADGAAGDVPWQKVQRRIAQLIKEDRFYTQEERDRFDDVDPAAIRESLAERGIVDGQVEEPEPAPPELSPEPEPSGSVLQDGKGQNFRITDDHLGEGGPRLKYQANVKAIRLLKELEAAGQQATSEQQEVLSRYVGWGGIPEVFEPEKTAWAREYNELKELLTTEEYEMARGSTLNAHYTSPMIIRAIYEAVEQMGFRTGNILEPSCGVGNFFGMLPENMVGSQLYGVELDSITGRIARQLYPGAHIEVNGFEKTQYPDGIFDLAIGNVPFGNYRVSDRPYDRHNLLIHDYFFAKAIDKVRTGGVIAFITSNGISGGTMDKKDAHARRYMAQRCDLLGAIRLPNTTFRANAGTDIAMDILFLQKREIPRTPGEPLPDWVETDVLETNTYTDKNGQERHNYVTMNRYFRSHPEMVLGDLDIVAGPYGHQLVCNPKKGADLEQQLCEAIRHIQGHYTEAGLPELGEGKDIDPSRPADPDVKNYSYTANSDIVGCI